MKQNIEELRKKYMDNPPEGITSKDIRLMSAFYGAQRSPFCFRTAAFRSQRPPIF